MSAFSTSGSTQPQRILAIWFPYLAAERILRRRLGRSWRSGPAQHAPLVVSQRQKNAQRIAALDEQAEALGLKVGMGIADARAMHPSIEVVEDEPAADDRLLRSLADWCDRYTPLVAVDGKDGLLLDVTGCTHLFGGEETLLEELVARLFQQGFDVGAAIAATPGAAWAAARYARNAILAPGEEAVLLATLPLAALRLDAETIAGLESVGLRTVGAILDAPRAPLARRFGAGLLLRLDQALGRAEAPISPLLPVAALSVERRLAEPVMTMADIEGLTFRLASALAPDLERRCEGARRLQLSLFRVDGAVRRIAAGSSRPLRQPARILELFRERFKALEGTLDPGFGFDLLRLSVLAAAPLLAAQRDLAGEIGEAEEVVARLADKVRARLGSGAILAAAHRASHLPEQAAELVPFEAAKPGDAPPPSLPERPLRLFAEPEPVDVVAAVSDGPPRNFRWRRMVFAVARAEGPERIAPEWWRQAEGAATRDYYRVEDREGRRFWLYRRGLYDDTPNAPAWFMHGIFA